MSQTFQVEPSKSRKVQTTLTYKQTKLNLGKLCITQSDETDTTKPSHDNKLRHSPKNNGKQAECIASKEQAVSEIPAIITSPEIIRVLNTDGVTKIVMDLETSSRGRIISGCIAIN
jgi:hypothetical protein